MALPPSPMVQSRFRTWALCKSLTGLAKTWPFRVLKDYMFRDLM